MPGCQKNAGAKSVLAGKIRRVETDVRGLTMEHNDKEVRAAIIRLSDALCFYERATGIESVLIVRERDFAYRAMSGKPGIPEDIPDVSLLASI